MDQKTLAIDFDGTLCKKQSFGNGTIWEVPNEGGIEAMKKFKKDGYRLVIFTARLSDDNVTSIEDYEKKKNKVISWLAKWDIPYDLITANKPNAVAYIDDRAIRFTNWQDISNYFLQ